MADGRLIVTVPGAAEHSGYSPDYIRDACQDGSLHATHRKVGGHWRIRIACLESWMAGQKCPHGHGAVAA